MGKARQTFERRQLGLTLRRLREAAGKSQQSAAAWIGKARSQFVELEDGRGTLAPDVLENLLDFYGVGGDERDTVVELGALARARAKRRAAPTCCPAPSSASPISKRTPRRSTATSSASSPASCSRWAMCAP